MANLMDLLQSQVSGQVLDQLSRKIGGTPQQTSTAVNTIFSAVLNGLSKNVSSPQGASALLGALDRDHDGSILNDLMGYLGGGNSTGVANASMLNGAGIINHILGGSQNGIIDAIAKMTGLDKSKIGSLLISLAPMILGVIGKVKQQNNLNAGGLSDLIKVSTQKVNQSNPAVSIFSQLLDKNGDGNVMDDIARGGVKSLLGRLFRKK